MDGFEEAPMLSAEERAAMLGLVADVCSKPSPAQNQGIVESKDQMPEITGNETSGQLLEMSLKRRADMLKQDTSRLDETRKAIVKNQRLDLIDELMF